MSRRILLSNDDGVTAPGLLALRNALEGLGEVVVVAPDSPQSASGHSITLTRPLEVRPFAIGPNRLPALSVAGRPADCVRLAIRRLLDAPVDLVVTGLNAGPNVGVNVFYSGTVAAAAEAAMLGVPAVAFSASLSGQEPAAAFEEPARLCRWVLDRLLQDSLGPGDLLNVNIPPLERDGLVAGVKFVPQSTAGLEDVYHLVHDGADVRSYRLGDEFSYSSEQENTDVVRLAEGYITITPLHVDMTNHDRLAGLSRLRWEQPGSMGE